jgi:two-component system OmpR family sensor kinase
MKRQSMTRRLILWLTGVVTVFWLLAAGLGVMVMQDEFGEIFDSSLQETAERLTPLVIDDLLRRENTSSPQHLPSASEEPESEYLTYQVRDAEGRVLLRSHDAPDTPYETPLQHGFWKNDAYQYYTVAANNNTIFVQVADAMANREEAIVEGGTALLLPVFFLTPLSIGIIWLVVRRAFKPVDILRAEIEKKDGGNMAALDAGPLPLELQPISNSVNRLLQRLRSALEAEREFTSNSAHELRTPIAGALAQTQMLIAELPDGSQKHRAHQIEASLSSLGHLAEKLLQLARADAGIGVTDAMVDLLPVIELVKTDFERKGTDPKKLLYQRQPGAELSGPYSKDGFAIVMRNLIENALLHGQGDEPVDIRVETNGLVRVINGALVLSGDELKTIRTRFGRGKSESPGSGIGLSIVERLLQQMNAELRLLSPAQGRSDGFEAQIHFSAVKPAP